MYWYCLGDQTPDWGKEPEGLVWLTLWEFQPRKSWTPCCSPEHQVGKEAPFWQTETGEKSSGLGTRYALWCCGLSCLLPETRLCLPPAQSCEGVEELTHGLGQSPNGLLIFNTGALRWTSYIPATTPRNLFLIVMISMSPIFFLLNPAERGFRNLNPCH